MLECAVTLERGGFKLDASLSAGAGVTAIVGASGAGKSTLLRLIAGLARPDSGRIELEGTVWADTEAGVFVAAEERGLGMVFQSPRIAPNMDVIGNIRLGRRQGDPDPGLLDRLGVTPLLGRPVAGLSGGERQRVMLARALYGKPRALLLDEPLTSLDSASRQALVALLAAVLPGLSIPVLYVTHSGEEAAQLARGFALMRDGRIVARGDAASVLGRGGAPRFEAGLATLVGGEVTAVSADGIADIAVGGQAVEVPSAGLRAGMRVQLRVWARDVILARKRPEGISARNALDGTVGALSPVADGQVVVTVSVDGGDVQALVMSRTVAEMGLEPGQPVVALFKSASVERAN